MNSEKIEKQDMTSDMDETSASVSDSIILEPAVALPVEWDLKTYRHKGNPYISPTPGSLPLIAVLPHRYSDAPEASVCQHMKTSGINCALMSIGVDKIKTGIDTAKAYGVRTLLAHNHFCTEPKRTLSEQLVLCADTVKKHKDNDGLGGYIAGNVPVKSTTLEMTLFPEKIRYHDPSRGVFSLVQANYPENTRDTEDYSEFLQTVQMRLRPSAWLVDAPAYARYAEARALVRYREFFNALETFAMMARYTLRPFWVTVRCDTVRVNDEESPYPSKGKMLFCALSALAYGAQGILYNQFRQRVSTNADTTYPVAPVTLDGEATEVLDNIRQVNARIKQLEGVFLGAQLMQVVHTERQTLSSGQMTTNDVPLTDDATDRSILYRKFRSPVGPLRKVSANGGGVLVSHLCTPPANESTGEAQDFLVVVNHDTEASQQVTLTFSPYFTVQKVTSARIGEPLISTTLSVNEQKQDFTYTLAAGDCLVFRWK